MGPTPHSYVRPLPRASPPTPQRQQKLSQACQHSRRRPCETAAAKKKQTEAASDVNEEQVEDLVADKADSGAEEDTNGSSGSAVAELLRNAFESGDEARVESAIQEAEELLSSSSSRADSAEISILASQATSEGLNDKYLRLSAEFENFRKRSAQEKAAALSKSKARIIEELLPTVDAFEAAAGQVKAETEGEQRIAASYQGLYAKLVDAFKKMGLEVVPGVGAPFDPEVHEAIMRAPSNDYPEGTVLQEFRRGFRIDSTLLRAAMVQVSFVDDEADADKASEA